MHKHSLSAAMLVIILIAGGAVSGRAQERRGFYVKANVGPTLVQDADLKAFPGTTATGEVEFDPGFRFDVGAGYRFVEWLAAEIDSGFVYNEIDSISGADETDARIVNLPFMFNLVAGCPTRGPVRPFFGGGVGFSSTALDVDEITLGGTTVFGGSETDVVFAYQGFGGLKFQIDPRWSVTLAYRYLGTQGAEWDVGSVFGGSDEIRLAPLHTHSVVVGFNFNF